MYKTLIVMLAFSIIGFMAAALLPHWIIGILVGLTSLAFMMFINHMNAKLECLLKQLDKLMRDANDVQHR